MSDIDYFSNPEVSSDEVEVYPDGDGEWRWRRKAANHKIISSSGESFDSNRNAIRAAARANCDIFGVDGEDEL